MHKKASRRIWKKELKKRFNLGRYNYIKGTDYREVYKHYSYMCQFVDCSQPQPITIFKLESDGD